MTNQEKLDELNKLVTDIDCLDPLYKWINDINYFDILKLDRMEIRHSNMLSWLLTPYANHGLGDKLLKKVLIYATSGTNIDLMGGLQPVNIALMNLDDVQVYREKLNIDILIISEKNKLLCAIENKIGSGEHSNQLNNYREKLLENYQDYNYILIYLSPEGTEASDNENWVSMSYNYVIQELDSILSINKVSHKAEIFIKDYITAIRRNVVEDSELENICKNIYIKHKEAFDIIFNNLPDRQREIADFIVELLKSYHDAYGITVWEQNTKNYIRFTPNKLVELYGEYGSGEWVNNKNLICFEMQNFKSSALSIKVIIGPSKDEFQDYRQKILDKAISCKYKMRGEKLTNKWKTIRTDNLVSQDLMDNLDFEYLRDEIDMQISNYFTHKLPKIVEELSVL